MPAMPYPHATHATHATRGPRWLLITAAVLADGKEIYVANDLRVGLFKREEDAAKDGAPQGEAA